MLPVNRKKLSLGIFFLALLLLGLNSFRDYGLPWDDWRQRATGYVSCKYIAERLAPELLHDKGRTIQNLHEYKDKDYGVAFEAPAVLLERVLKLEDSRDIYMFRHLLVFIVFVAGVVALYCLAARRFNDWRIGLLAAIFLVLSPRFFAEAFYNSKDIVFMAVLAISTNTMINFVTKPSIRSALVHALATAYAIDVRIMGVMILVGTILLLVLKSVKKELPLHKFSRIASIYLSAACFLVIAMFPYLWENPFGNFVEAFKNMSKFRWPGEVLYMGTFIRGTELPWHYSLVWISITTPLLYLVLFLTGCFATLKELIMRRLRLWTNDTEMQDLVFLVLFFLPIFSVVLFNSVLYGGWRQLYFVYPAFLLITIKGWVSLWNLPSFSSKKKGVITLMMVSTLIYHAYWMWQSHPLQNVYFNAFAGEELRTRFDLDYWGLGNRQALEYILAHDKNPTINVWADSLTPLGTSFMILRPEERARLNLARDTSLPLYVLNNYRGASAPNDAKYSEDYDLYYQIKIDDEVILSVYKLIK